MGEALPAGHYDIDPDDAQEASAEDGDERWLHRLAHASQRRARYLIEGGYPLEGEGDVHSRLAIG